MDKETTDAACTQKRGPKWLHLCPKDRALALVTLGNNGGLQTDAALESGRACYGFLIILRLQSS